MQAISFVARRGAGMAEHGLFLESSEASSFLVLGNQDISINMARHSVAGYVRSGNDLILNLSDGREIVLENYFGATGSDANRLFLSSNGLIEQVAFEFGPDGSVYPMYQGAESWGKWGPSQDLVFYEEPSPIGIADAATGYEDETVSMLGTAMALGPGLALGGGSVAAVLGTTALASTILQGGEGGGETPIETGTQTPATPSTQPPATVQGTGTTIEMGGPNTPESIVVNGTGETGANVSVEIGGATETTTVDGNGNWSVTFTGGNFPVDGNHSANVTVVDPDGEKTNLTGPSYIIDTTAPSLQTKTVELDDVVNIAEAEDGFVLKGTTEPGSFVTVEWNGLKLTATGAEDGTWSVSIPAENIPDGEVQTIAKVTAVDQAGNSASVNHVIHIDTEISAGLDTGLSGGDDVVNAVEAQAVVVLTGTADENANVVVSVNNQNYETQADDAGNWSVNIPANALPGGTYELPVKVTASDSAGNTATSSGKLKVDTEANVTISAETVETDGVINAQELSDGSVSITGSTDPGSSVSVTVNGLTQAATVDETGEWSVNVPASVFPAGENNVSVSATATDTFGNSSTAVEAVSVDTIVNKLTAEEQSSGSDNFVNASEAQNGLLITGDVEPGSSVFVTYNGKNYTASVHDDGTWSALVPASELADGEYVASYSVTATDGVGNTSTINDVVSVDTLVNKFTAKENSSGDDAILNAEEMQNGMVLTGKVEPGSKVTVTFDGQNYDATVDENGNWTATVPASAIKTGDYVESYSVTATDPAGNIASISGQVTIDTEKPDAINIISQELDVETGATEKLSVEQTEDSLEVVQVFENGDPQSLSVFTYDVAQQDRTYIGFNSKIPDGSSVVVAAEDALGNQSAALVFMDTKTDSSRNLVDYQLSDFDINVIDLQSMGGTTLTITEADILALSKTTDIVTIRGDAGDTVIMEGAAKSAQTYTEANTGTTYSIYTLGDDGATVYLDEDIAVTV